MPTRPVVGSILLVACAALAVAQSPEEENRVQCARSVGPESQRQMWHRLSLQAELIASSGVTSSRRRGVRLQEPGAPINFIDEEIFGKMRADGVRWTQPATDEEFLRRVYLDLTGQIPRAEDVKRFLADTRRDKRDRVIEQLLHSEGFVDRWTLWFGDHVQNVVHVGDSPYPMGRNLFYEFMRESIRTKPYDQMVREVITATGQSWREGPVNYWVRQIVDYGPAQDTFDNLSADTGEKFLGLPLTCLSCHDGRGHLEAVNTSLARRTREDFWKNAAFFSADYALLQDMTQVDPFPEADGTILDEYMWSVNPFGTSPASGQAPTGPIGGYTSEYMLNTVNGARSPRQPAPGRPDRVQPAFFLSGEAPRAGERRRDAYARILTAHPQFARATVNYIWKEIFGLGIVEPANSHDLLRQDPATLGAGQTLQPTHPALLTRLADSFVANGYDLRALLRTIVRSNAYQLSSLYTPGPWKDIWTPYYARHYPRRMLAESVPDAITRATGVPAAFRAHGYQRNFERAIELPGPAYRYEPAFVFFDAFGRGDRQFVARSNHGSINQALVMLNDPFVTVRVKAEADSTVQRLLRETSDPATIAEELYIATLSRRPTAAERLAAIELLRDGDLTHNAEDLQFVLLNRLEFLYN